MNVKLGSLLETFVVGICVYKYTFKMLDLALFQFLSKVQICLIFNEHTCK